MKRLNISIRFGVAVLLVVVASTAPSFAEWKLIDDNVLAKVYFDPDKMKKSSSFPEMWQMTDLKNRASTGVMSRLVLIQFDCVDKKRRTLASAGYPAHMAQGKPIFSDASQGNWHPVLKETVINTTLEMACAKEEMGGEEK